LTKVSITGPPTSTSTTVAKTTGKSVPKRDIATDTASSKKLEAPIILVESAIL